MFTLLNPIDPKSFKQLLQFKIIIKNYKIVKVGSIVAGRCEVQIFKLYVVNTKISGLSESN